jgi:hypothetical protein
VKQNSRFMCSTRLALSLLVLISYDAAAREVGHGGDSEIASSGDGPVDEVRIGGSLHLLLFEDVAGGLKTNVDFPVHRYLLLGPVFKFAAYGGGAEIGIEAQLKPRLPLNTDIGLVEIYAAVPLGLGLSACCGGADVGFSWGVLPGVNIFFLDNFGTMLEMGVTGVSGDRASFTMNLGVVYSF